jgi:hypothetical protein
MFVEQSWEAALAALTVAAERGWSAAQHQLRVLAAHGDRSANALAAQSTDPTRWRRSGGRLRAARRDGPASRARRASAS